MIDLMKVEPTKISRDLKGKYMLLYGMPKSGKTSLAVEWPRSLLLGFEKGYNALPGISAVDIPKWSTMKEVLAQLRRPEVQETYDTVIIDTATIALELCEEFICQQKNVDAIGDVPWGAGYKAMAKEFSKTMRQITLMGYGMVFIAHHEEKPIAGEDDAFFVCPSLDKRGYKIINALVDIIAYIQVDFETSKRFLITRANKNVVAGSRFKYLSDKIELSYDNLVSSLAEAIEKAGAEKGGLITDDRMGVEEEVKMRPFEEAMIEARNLWGQLVTDDDQSNYKAIEQIIKNQFGSVIPLSTITENQQDLFEYVIEDLKELLASTK